MYFIQGSKSNGNLQNKAVELALTMNEALDYHCTLVRKSQLNSTQSLILKIEILPEKSYIWKKANQQSHWCSKCYDLVNTNLNYKKLCGFKTVQCHYYCVHQIYINEQLTQQNVKTMKPQQFYFNKRCSSTQFCLCLKICTNTRNETITRQS